MSFTNSPLIVHTNLSPNYNKRRKKIDTITPHVIVGHASLKSLGQWFAKRSAQCSSNYGIDDAGSIGMFVEEKNRSWCTSSPANDHRAITIEIASDASHPYAITHGAQQGLINLCVDVCKRNNIPKLLWKADKNLIGKIDQQNISVHRWFAAKACPGDYVYNRLGQIADEVNKILLSASIVPPVSSTGFPYLVKINTDILRYRSGPGTNYPIVGQVRRGEVYTIVEEALGSGSSKWGRVKSGAGWVALDYCIKMR